MHTDQFKQAIKAHQSGDYTRALELYHQIIERQPELVDVHTNIACIYQDRGLNKQALNYFKKAFALEPTNKKNFSNYFCSLRNQSHYSNKALLTQALQWNSLHPTTPCTHFNNQLNFQRRLKIGYVSTDFCNHSAAKVFGMLYLNHSQKHFEIYSYAQIIKNDSTTTRFKELSNHWHEITYLSDKAVFELIQEHQIDILVDLNGHTAHNRLGVFSLRPAPIQITGLGFGCTTGMKTMDYQFSDIYITPPNLSLFYSEKVIYLSSLIRWNHPQVSLEVKPLPYLKNGYITFGYSQALFKLNTRVLSVWAKILHQLPKTKLHLKDRQFNDPHNCQRILNQFKALGIESHRLHFMGQTNQKEHLLFNHQIDISLDPFPYNGGISICETLWMGVPVISLVGGSRSGYSILSVLGLKELIADNEEEYIALNIKLAQNPDQLKSWRTTLRKQVEESSICDRQGFTKEVENIYTILWKRWIQQQGENTTP